MQNFSTVVVAGLAAVCLVGTATTAAATPIAPAVVDQVFVGSSSAGDSSDVPSAEQRAY